MGFVILTQIVKGGDSIVVTRAPSDTLGADQRKDTTQGIADAPAFIASGWRGDGPMDQSLSHPLHYTPINDGAKWNSIFSARGRYLANARPLGNRRGGLSAEADLFFQKPNSRWNE
jgi:hypothetical protein